MNNVSVLIVEDEPASQLTLETALYELNYSDWLSADNAEDALRIIKDDEPDIILMDINIKGEMTGIDIAKAIKQKMIPIIFITGFGDRDTFNKAKEVAPAAFLVKPFNKLTLEAAIDTAIRSLTLETEYEEDQKDAILPNCIFIKNGTVFQKVKFDDILWVQSDGNYSIVFTESKKFALRISLVKVIDKMPAKTFIRIHKRFIVQASKIDKIDTFDKEIYVNGNPIPLGRTYKEELLARLTKI